MLGRFHVAYCGDDFAIRHEVEPGKALALFVNEYINMDSSVICGIRGL
jgi:hypothetical protein